MVMLVVRALVNVLLKLILEIVLAFVQYLKLRFGTRRHEGIRNSVGCIRQSWRFLPLRNPVGLRALQVLSLPITCGPCTVIFSKVQRARMRRPLANVLKSRRQLWLAREAHRSALNPIPGVADILEGFPAVVGLVAAGHVVHGRGSVQSSPEFVLELGCRGEVALEIAVRVHPVRLLLSLDL